MHIELIIPDLIFKRPDYEKSVHPLFELDLPSLTILLDAAISDEALIEEASLLAQICGLDVNPPYGIAALTAEFEGLPAKTGCWLRADPVRMQISQDTVYCLGQQQLNLDIKEARSLIESINSLLQEEGLHLSMGDHPLHWYIKTEERVSTLALSRIVGKSILGFLPSELIWQKRLTEIQMLLKSHPVNLERQKRKLATIDGLWLWGQGHYPKLSHARKDVIYADNDDAKAVAKAANLPCFDLPQDREKVLEGPYQKIVFISHQLQRALEQADFKYWKAELLQIERSLFLPLLLALKNKKIDSLVLHFCEGLSYSVNRRNLKKWWKRPASLQSLLS